MTSSSATAANNNKVVTSRLKKSRSSLACIRCRNKKVKCDFVQPTCGRCNNDKISCNYATPPRRVDGQAFDELNNHINELKKKVQSMQFELGKTKNSRCETMAVNNNQDCLQSAVAWKLSLTPSGLRIDTNISNVIDLYRILLTGVTQININRNFLIAGSLFNMNSNVGIIDSVHDSNDKQRMTQENSSNLLIGHSSSNTYLVSSDITEMQDTHNEHDDINLSQGSIHNIVHSCYHTCFLSYQIVDKEDFIRKYNNPVGSEALLIHSINAWMTKHACIYHNDVGCKKGNPIMEGETHFKQAQQLLKRYFDMSRPSTIHALLNLYMYQLSSERSSLAYLYIGLAIRMAQDLKFHKREYMPTDLKQREVNKRLWWSAYWLDLCAALESNRPTMVDDKDCDLEYPTKLDSEDEETGYRISFCVQSIELMKIRKDLTKHLPSENSGPPLLSAISRLETSLMKWLHQLPEEFKYNIDDAQAFTQTNSFRDEACLILNIQYHTTWIMLHKLFLSDQQESSKTPISLLSLNICTRSANLITHMLDLYSKQPHWCHFFYILDGILASIHIHQLNALSNEEDISRTAQQNLILTVDILHNSPLIYMKKVNIIIQRIEDFFVENHLNIRQQQANPDIEHTATATANNNYNNNNN
ncbi:fungal-specific transcription factor domain-containing protein, partial [Cokeromyces recurvatus]|uniref:fungal-specific transcription factor domain-containing protein n=1 Tax=Cokeromyces recurvatus TaxID=90255 RepID=UPI002220FE18